MDYASMIVGIIRYYEKKAQLAELAGGGGRVEGLNVINGPKCNNILS